MKFMDWLRREHEDVWYKIWWTYRDEWLNSTRDEE